MKQSRKRLRPEKESGETEVCRQGVVNTRQSDVFVALSFFFFLTRFFFCAEGWRKCLPPLLSPGAGASCGKCTSLFLRVLKDGGGGRGEGELCFLTCSFRDPRQADYGVLLTRTNCLSVRSEEILLWVSLSGFFKRFPLFCGVVFSL